MALHNSVVLDLSGLETAELAHAGAAIAQVQMCLARGKRVIAVVAPSPERSDRDLAASNRLGPTADSGERAAILVRGAEDAAEAFVALLSEAGLDAAAADPALWPGTRGHPLDAEPRSVSGIGFARAMEESTILVVPGGVGRDELGVPTSLGSHTAPLTAVFLADRLALRIERPAGAQERAESSVGSRKTARFIERSGVEVRTPNADATPALPVRVGILGDSPSAAVAASWIEQLGPGFELDRTAAAAEADILIDFTRDAGETYEPISRALRTGRTVITTNAAMLAERGGGLSIAALIGGGSLRASGSIAGCPALAGVLDRLSVWPGVRRVQGTLSPAGDRVLELRSRGLSPEEAERRTADELGLTPDDIARARRGEDAMETLAAVAQLAFGSTAGVRAAPRGPEHVSDLDLERAAAQGRRFRIIATAERIGDRIALRVGPVPVRADDPLVTEESGSVRAIVETRTGELATVAGRLHQPGSVAAAVLRDLIETGRVPSPALHAGDPEPGVGRTLGITA